MEWTDDSVATLRNLWTAGLSAGQIAARLDGFSRNAVLGKLSRLKLLRSRSAASPPGRAPLQPMAPANSQIAAASVATRPEPDYPPLDVPESAFTPLPGVPSRPWLSRDPGECAFPVGGDGAGLMSCCAPVQRRSAYCSAHHARVFCVEGARRDPDREARWVELVSRWAA